MRQFTNDLGFARHVRLCNDAVLPGNRVPFMINDNAVGWIPPRMAPALAAVPSITPTATSFTLHDPAALPRIAQDLALQGLFHCRGEMFDVRATLEGPALAQIDRGAVPAFGTMAVGVHLNGLVRRSDGLHLWVGRRASNRLLDPGKLDHIVAGGVPAGLGPAETLIKEAAEEAAIPAGLAAQASPAGVICYAMERPEGLRRDCLYCYDLTMPGDFQPKAADGEVEAFELWPIKRVMDTVRDTDEFKFNVNLVLIDLFIRLGLLAGTDAQALRAELGSHRHH